MNLKNNLIQSCVCGNDSDFTKQVIHYLNVLKCNSCGVVHQDLEGWTPDRYSNFYKNDYHINFQQKKGVVSYKDRYDHDCMVAEKRLNSYDSFLKQGMIGLDVGSSNSAFVHRANLRKLDCTGLEPGMEIGDDQCTIRGTLESADLNADHYDFITMHDSIEHMIDVNRALTVVKRILKKGGLLFVDLPDYFIPDGYHHWKKIEHLWLFSQDDFKKLLEQWGFFIEQITTPIPGKLVFFARKQ